MGKKNLRTAVIGAGNMGVNHLRVLSELSQLVAVVDVNATSRMAAAQRYAIPGYADVAEMMAHHELDAVTIAVPTKHHVEVAQETISRGVPTLVEKPISNSLPQAIALEQLARENKVYMSVGHIERFNPSILTLKRMIDQNKLGTIVSLLAIRVGIAPPRSRGSDVVIDLAIHDIDVFNFLLGRYPNSASVTRKKLYDHSFSDVAAIKLAYRKAVGLIQTNWITPVKMRRLYVTGSNGFAEIDYIQQELTLYDKTARMEQPGDFLDIVSYSTSPKKEVFVSKEEPLKLELEYFLNNITQKKPDAICTSAIKALEVAFIS